MRKTSAFNKLTAVMCSAIIIAVFAVFGTMIMKNQAKFDNVSASQTLEDLPADAPVTLTSAQYACGDVNGDEKINELDVLLLHNHLFQGAILTEAQLKSADVNSDNTVDATDEMILRAYLNGNITSLPFSYLLKFGDTNLDGVVNTYDVEYIQSALDKKQSLNLANEINSDVNVDGTLSNDDVRILSAYVKGLINTLPCKTTIKLGDVNLDNEINGLDAALLTQVVTSSASLNDAAKLNADLNQDNIVNKADQTILALYLEKKVSLPYTYAVKLGDVNQDGKINLADCDALSRGIKSGFKNSDAVLNADVNADSAVDYRDLAILEAYVNKEVASLPYTTAILYGDVNLSGNVNGADSQALSNAIKNGKTDELSIQAKLSADVNIDGKLDKVDVAAIETFNQGDISLPTNVKLIYGDVNLDKQVNTADLVMLNSMLKSEITLNALQALNADTTADGVINQTDLGVLKAYLDGKIRSLPFDPAKMTVLDKIAQSLGETFGFVVVGGEWIYNGIVGTGEWAYNGIKTIGEGTCNVIVSAGEWTYNCLCDIPGSIKGAGETVYNGVTNIPDAIVDTSEWFYNGFVTIGEGTYNVIIGTGNAIKGAGEWIYNCLCDIPGSIKGAGETAYNGIVAAGEWVYNGIVAFGELCYDGPRAIGYSLKDFCEWCYNGLCSIGDAIHGAGKAAYDGIVSIPEAIKAAGEWFYNGLASIGQGSLDGIKGAGETVYDGIITIGEGAYNGVAGIGNAVKGAGEWVYNSITNLVK